MQFQNTQMNILFRLQYLVLVWTLVLPAWVCQGQEPSSSVVSDKPALEAIDDASFGELIERLSGRGGYFDTDNLISNESSYLHVIGALKKLNLSGGAYLGVGPDQNFSYIAHLRPHIAIILDIRRDNMLMHLFYKALFEMSDDRLSFLAHLFGRFLPENGKSSLDWDVERLMAAVDEAPDWGGQREAMQEQILAKVQQFGVSLSEEDMQKIRRFHDEFIARGPGLRFTSHGRSPQYYYPTYRQLALETDREGNQVSFLSEEAHFKYIKSMHESNKIIPVVGNFSDTHALPEIGIYLKEIGEKVIAFYTSNVEFYLMNQRQFSQFVSNVQRLPLVENGVIIRSYFNRFRMSHPQSLPGYGSTQLLQSMDTFVGNPDASYGDLVFKYALPE